MFPNYADTNYKIKIFIKGLIYFFISISGLSYRAHRMKSQWKKIKINSKFAVIIAGGPSYNDELKKYLILNREKFDLVAMNYYCLNDSSDQLIPDWYILSDHGVINEWEPEFLSKNVALRSYLDVHKIPTIIPYGKSWSKSFGINSISFEDRQVLFSANIKPYFPRGYTSNTAFKAIALTQYMGYSKVFILGMDFDWPKNIFLSDDNRLMYRDNHHYGSSVRDFSKYFTSVAHALNWWYQDYLYSFKLSSNVMINVTNTSLLDCFQRMDPNDFINGKGF